MVLTSMLNGVINPDQSFSGDDATKEPIDEIKNYLDCKYVSPCEATYRLLGYDIHDRDPPVERLSFHLPDEQSIIFSDSDQIDEVLNRPRVRQSMFTAWMDANKKYEIARNLTYAEFSKEFVWKSTKREWQPRKEGFSIGCIFYIPPWQGEMYYLRTLLNVVRGPRSFEDNRRVNGVQYNSFRDACYVLGLLNDNKEYIDGIIEVSKWGSTHSLRSLFATLLMSGSRPEVVWQSCLQYLSDDIIYMRRHILGHEGLQLSEKEIQNLTLLEIEKTLRSRGKSLSDFPEMMYPNDVDASIFDNRLISDEMMYDRSLLAKEHK